MEQIAVNFTDGWVPKTWLTPTINIIDRAGNVYITNWALKELWNWWYIYNFDRYNPTKVYLYMFDWWATLTNDYDRYKFGGNEFDAYSNKYSWGRTAAPYFTSINWRFDNVDRAFKEAEKNRYDDSEIKKAIREVKREIRGVDLSNKLSELQKLIETVNTSVKNESSSKWVSSVNEKLDLMAQYVVQMKQNLDTELNSLDENVAARIEESNNSLNEWMSSRVTIDQLLQQVERLENKMNSVLDTFVKTQMEWLLPKEISDQYDMNITRKNGMSDEDLMRAIWMWEWLNEWLNEGMEEWMSEWLEQGVSEWLWMAREEWVNAPVDMQWIAEPEMPMTF